MQLTNTCRVLLTLLLLVLPSIAQKPTETFHGHQVAARQVLVKFKTAQPSTIAQAEWLEDTDVAEKINKAGVVRIHSRSKNAASLISDLSGRSDVLYAEPDYIVHAISAPNDPDYGQMWAMKNTGQAILGSQGASGSDIGAEAAWNVTTGTNSVVVGVVDTGIDYNHADLAANVWTNPGDVGGCPAGTHGYNAVTKSCDPMDDNFHGTHVSGTIGAVGNNSAGVVGVNWTTSIMALKFLDSSGSGTTSDAIAAIDFAIQAKLAGTNVRVLSNSWGGGSPSQALLDEINSANDNDILFVAAAGNGSADNDYTPTYPASYNAPNLIAVAATDNADNLASFSNYGANSVHLAAPGVSILSTTPGGSYGYASGTSMATPHVAGAAALILSTSTLSTAQLKSTILNSVDSVSSLAGRTITGGRLNVCKAIPGCGMTAPSTPPEPSTPPDGTWTKVAMEGDTVFLPSGTTYRFGVDGSFLDPVTTTADLQVYVYYTNFGGDPAPGVVKELDVAGDGTGVIVNGTPFK